MTVVLWTTLVNIAYIYVYNKYLPLKDGKVLSSIVFDHCTLALAADGKKKFHFL